MRCRTFSTLQPSISLRFIGWVLLNINLLTRNTLDAGSLTQPKVCISIIAPTWHLCVQTHLYIMGNSSACLTLFGHFSQLLLLSHLLGSAFRWFTSCGVIHSLRRNKTGILCVYVCEWVLGCHIVLRQASLSFIDSNSLTGCLSIWSSVWLNPPFSSPLRPFLNLFLTILF